MRNLLPMAILIAVGGIFAALLFDDTAARTGIVRLSLLVFLGLQLGDMQDKINRLKP